MTPQRSRRVREIAALAALCAVFVPAAGGAQVVRPAGPVVRPATAPGAVTRPAGSQATANAVAGTITEVSGNILTIKLRDGRTQRVDATTAVTHGSYSAPLFVGKIVLIEGTRAANGTFDAVRVTRLPSLNQLPADR